MIINIIENVNEITIVTNDNDNINNSNIRDDNSAIKNIVVKNDFTNYIITNNKKIINVINLEIAINNSGIAIN